MAAKKLLTFKVAEVKPLVESALAAKSHRVTYSQLYDASLHFGGKVKKKDGFPDSANIDYSKVPPAIWLVKDQGCYVMSSAVVDPPLPEGVRLPIAYAQEANPDVMPFDEWWEASRYIMGGDDCVIDLPIDWFKQAIASGKDTFALQIRARDIRLIL